MNVRPFIDRMRNAYQKFRHRDLVRHFGEYMLLHYKARQEGWDILYTTKEHLTEGTGSFDRTMRKHHDILMGYRELRGVPWAFIVSLDYGIGALATRNSQRLDKAYQHWLEFLTETERQYCNPQKTHGLIFLNFAKNQECRYLKMVNEAVAQGQGIKTGLEESLYDSDIPEHCIEPLAKAIDDEIHKLELVTNKTLAGVRGGTVGKVQLSSASYIIKVQSDSTMAYKDAAIPAFIHEQAAHGLLFTQLARRVPVPFLSEPVEHQGYWITLSEDVSGKAVSADAIDLKIMLPMLGKGYPSRLVEMLYTAVLFQEAMSCSYLKMFHKESVPFVQSAERVEDRLSRLDLRKVASFFPSLYQDWAEEVQQYHAQGKLQGLVDNRHENYVSGHFVDFGLSARGSEVPDLVRPLLLEPEIATDPSRLQDYVYSYVGMRRHIQELFKGEAAYVPDSGLFNIIRKATALDALRFAGGERRYGSGFNAIQSLHLARDLAE